MRSLHRPALAALVVFCATDAWAQLSNLDRQEGRTFVGTQVDLGIPDRNRLDRPVHLRADLFAQLYWTHAGAYLSLPFSRSIRDGGADETAIGNVEIGANADIDLRALRLGVRIGFVLPTAGDSAAEAALGRAAILGRYTDVASAIPEVFAFRLSISPRYEGGLVFVRGDLGFDVMADVSQRREDDLWALMRLNVAAGVRWSVLSFAIEWVNTLDLRGNGPPAVQAPFTSTLGFTLGVSPRYVQPWFNVTVPLDDTLRDRVDVVLTVGLRAEL